MHAMSGYGPFDGFTLMAIALAVFLSALVSLIGTSGRKRNIALGEAQVIPRRVNESRVHFTGTRVCTVCSEKSSTVGGVPC